MDAQFVDRTLTCSDCHGEFIFTAGEQLFFHDKQFKNDPKRCKPCKLRRSGLAAAANGAGLAAAGLSRTETRTECSECGIQTTVPFKPTQGRPVLCRQCYQTRNKAIAAAAAAAQAATPGVAVPAPIETPAPLPMAAVPVQQTVSALTEASMKANGASLSADAAVQAAASMAAASPQSSVASAADLASIMETVPEGKSPANIPTELLAAAASDGAHAELIAATVAADAGKA